MTDTSNMKVPGGILIGVQTRRASLVRVTKPEEVTNAENGVAALIELIAQLTDCVHTHETTIRQMQSNFSKLSTQFEELYEKLRTAHSHASTAQTAAAILARELRHQQRVGFSDDEDEDEE